MDKNVKNTTISLRIAEGDLTEIDKRAREANRTRSDYMIHAALGSEPTDKALTGVEKRLAAIERRLKKIEDTR